MRAILRSLVITAAVAAGFAATPAAAQQAGASWFSRADRNDDGRVTWAEYQRTQRSYDALSLDRSGRYGRGGTTAQFDRNRDGRITRIEYSQSLRAQFARYDRNDDNIVTRREAASNADRRGDDRRSDDRHDGQRSGDRRRS